MTAVTAVSGGARNSSSSTTAAASSSPVAQLANVDKLLGQSVTFTLGDKDPRTVSGKLWAYDPALAVVAIECTATPLDSVLSSAPAAAASVAQASQASRSGKSALPSVGFRIIKVAEITKIQFERQTESSSNGGAATTLTPVHPVSLKTAQLRETDAVRQSLAKLARTGKDVSKLGQLIFDALSKTLPCRWHQSHILVMEEVVISGPGYDPESTNVPGYTRQQLQSLVDGTHKGPVPAGAQTKANSWNRVVKVLQGERRKILAS